MRYVTVEVKVDKDGDAAAENVVMEILDLGVYDGEIVTYQVTEIEKGWSQAARDLGAHR